MPRHPHASRPDFALGNGSSMYIAAWYVRYRCSLLGTGTAKASCSLSVEILDIILVRAMTVGHAQPARRRFRAWILSHHFEPCSRNASSKILRAPSCPPTVHVLLHHYYATLKIPIGRLRPLLLVGFLSIQVSGSPRIVTSLNKRLEPTEIVRHLIGRAKGKVPLVGG